jgi:2-amino-4-hydroxy-6-hydroxymethyldihydropteridine diphosphokinase
MTLAVLGLGANLGERLDALQRAVDLLDAEPGIVVGRSSRIWETAPVGPQQPDFLNAVVEIETSLEPLEVLAACQRAEQALGRTREVRWGPRTLDVDVLFYGDVAVDLPELVVPHPRLTERAFVILPLLDLRSDPVLPSGVRILEVPTGPDMASGAWPILPPLAPSRPVS